MSLSFAPVDSTLRYIAASVGRTWPWLWGPAMVPFLLRTERDTHNKSIAWLQARILGQVCTRTARFES